MSISKSFRDQPNSFGWISIALHWTTAIAVVALWFIGKSIVWLPVEEMDERRSLHVFIGLCAWLPLVVRIVWRVQNKHPRASGQTMWAHKAARGTHYLLLACLTIMILSGPFMAWLLPERSAMFNIAFTGHRLAANALLLLVLLHVGGALKHLMFNDDETISRIFVPRTVEQKDE